MTRPTGVPDGAIWQTGLWGTREAAWELCARLEGLRDGAATYWRVDGTLLARTTYFRGVEHGLHERFHESGEVSQRGAVVDGERHGQHDAFRSISLTSERAVEGKHDSIWRCSNDYEDGAIVRYTRYFDREGQRVDQAGQRLPVLPPGVPATAIVQAGAWIDGRIVHGRWHGPFRRWTLAGILIEEGAYRRGHRTGPFIRWTRHGVELERGTYVGGQIKDHWIARPAEVPASAVAEAGVEVHWLDGDAVRSRWNEDGQLIEQRQYEAGVLDGPALAWNADGALIARSIYVRGELEGVAERFFADGTITSSVAYAQGVPTGTSVLVRRPDESPAGFPVCSPRIVRAEQTGATLRLFDGFGVECTADGTPEELWRARFPGRARWRDAVRAQVWPDAEMPRALLDLVADDPALRGEARALIERRCARERDPVSPIALDFAIQLLRIAGTRDRGPLLEVLHACGEATDLAPAIATFVAVLADPDPTVRALVTPILAQLDGKTAIAPLRAALAREPDAAVRASLHLALGALGEAVAAGLIAADPLERLGSALGIVAARGAKAPATATTALIAALADPEPMSRRFHTIPWARTTLVAQVCEALRDAGARPRATLDALIAALAGATPRSAPVLVDALLTLGGDFATLDAARQAVIAAIAGCEPAWELGAIRELLRRRELPVDREALTELARQKRKRKRKDA